MGGKRIMASEWAKIKRLYLRGVSHHDISRQTHRASKTILTKAREEGWDAEREEVTAAALAKVTDEEPDKIAKEVQRIERIEERLYKAIEDTDLSKEKAKDLLREAREWSDRRMRLLGLDRKDTPPNPSAPNFNVLIVQNMTDEEMAAQKRKLIESIDDEG